MQTDRRRRGCRARCWLLAAVGIAILLAEQPATAGRDAAGAVVAVGPFVGRRASHVRAAVVRVLRTRYQVGRPRQTGIAALVTGRVRQQGRRWQVVVMLRGSDGAARVGAAWQVRRSREVARISPPVRRRLLNALGDLIASGPALADSAAAIDRKSSARRGATAAGKAQPAAPDPAIDAAADDEPLFQQGLVAQKPAPEERASTAALRQRRARRVERQRRQVRAAEASLGVHLSSRRLRYSDDIFGTMRPHTVGTATELGGSGVWYPAAHFTSGWPSRIGVSGSFRRAVGGVAPVPSNGVDYPAAMYSAAVGLRGWHPLGRGRLEVGAGLSFGVQALAIQDVAEASRRLAVPGVEYRFLRVGLDLTVRLWRGLAAAGRLAYLGVLDSGELGSLRFFPNATGGGVAAGAALSYEMWGGLAARLGFDLRRFVVSANPEPGDANVVGGATDQYLTLTMAVVYHLRWRRR